MLCSLRDDRKPHTPIRRAMRDDRAMAVDVDELVAALPEGAVLTDQDVIEPYRRDWARDPDAGRPCAVVRATCTADVQAVLRWASAHGVPVVPRGAGSGLSGGSTAV